VGHNGMPPAMRWWFAYSQGKSWPLCIPFGRGRCNGPLSCEGFDFPILLLEISIIRKGFPIWIAHAAYEGSDDRHGFQTPLSLIEPGQSLRNRVDLVVVTPMWERKEFGN